MKPVDVEGLLVGVLRPVVAPSKVATKLPNPRPAQFVRVTRAGGARRNVAQSGSRVIVECWAASETDAWALCVAAYDALDDLDVDPGELPFMSVDLSDPVNYPDTATGSPRYQFIATIITNLKE